MKKYISPIVLSLLLILSSLIQATTSAPNKVYDLGKHSEFKMLLVEKRGGLSRNAAGSFGVLENILEKKILVTSKTLAMKFLIYKPYRQEILSYIEQLERDRVIKGDNIETLKKIFSISSIAQADKVLSEVAKKLNELNGIGI
jgi:hypothetical protein